MHDSDKKVYVVEHLNKLAGDRESIKMIGVYSSRFNAEAAISRLRNKPGFCDFPKLIDPFNDKSREGFYIDEYLLDKDNWEEGFKFVRIDADDA